MKKPKFFCDNCGTEVGRNHRACPGCGRFFSSVRCPRCGFSGEDKLFAAGCPSCGYSAPEHGDSAMRKAGRKKVSYMPSGPLPLWVYVFSICAVLIALAALFMLLFIH